MLSDQRPFQGAFGQLFYQGAVRPDTLAVPVSMKNEKECYSEKDKKLYGNLERGESAVCNQ